MSNFGFWGKFCTPNNPGRSISTERIRFRVCHRKPVWDPGFEPVGDENSYPVGQGGGFLGSPRTQIVVIVGNFSRLV